MTLDDVGSLLVGAAFVALLVGTLAGAPRALMVAVALVAAAVVCWIV